MLRRATMPALAALCAALVAGCAGTVSDAYVIADDPGHVEHVDDSGLGQVTLTEQAAERLRIATAPVATRGRHLEVPDTAVFVDPEGTWWVYTNPSDLTYVRHEVEIVRHLGDQVLLAHGPKPGTDVVTVGVAEIYGVEDEVGH